MGSSLEKKNTIIYRGDVFKINLGEENIVGSEQKGFRYCVVIQNDTGNTYSPTVIVALLTSKHKCSYLPTHFEVDSLYLAENSVVMCEQIRTVDKKRLINYKGSLNFRETRKLDKCLKASLSL